MNIVWYDTCQRWKNGYTNISGFFFSSLTARDIHAANSGRVSSNHNYEENFSLNL